MNCMKLVQLHVAFEDFHTEPAQANQLGRKMKWFSVHGVFQIQLVEQACAGLDLNPITLLRDLLKLQRLQCERMAMQKWQGLSTPKLYERAIKEKLYQQLEDSALLDKLCYEPTKFRTDVLHHIVQRKWGAQLADVEDEAVV